MDEGRATLHRTVLRSTLYFCKANRSNEQSNSVKPGWPAYKRRKEESGKLYHSFPLMTSVGLYTAPHLVK